MDRAAAFIRHNVAYARSLPLTEAVEHLRGMLAACVDAPALDEVRRVVATMRDSDTQLELIASGQLRLSLAGEHEDRSPEGAD